MQTYQSTNETVKIPNKKANFKKFILTVRIIINRADDSKDKLQPQIKAKDIDS